MSETIEQDEIKVSVIVITYNHEKYIRKALDSILMQKVDFKYEILVGDDASIDSTPEIIREYKEKYPEYFNISLREKNLGGTRNSYELMMMAKGDYIANLEGDDYWIDENKLQKQVDFLEKHDNFVGCVSDFMYVDEKCNPYPESDGQILKSNLYFDGTIYTLNEFNKSLLASHTSTLIYRNIYKKGIDAKIIYKAHRVIGDCTTLMLLLSVGTIYKMDEIMSCYRYVRNSSSWTSAEHENPFQNYHTFMYYTLLEKYASEKLHMKVNLGNIKARLFYGMLMGYFDYRSPSRKECIRRMLSATNNKLNYIRLILDIPMQRKVKAVVKQALLTGEYLKHPERTWRDFDNNAKKMHLVLFGAGGGMREYLDCYYFRHDIEFVVDNDEKKVGKYERGFKIFSPQALRGCNADNTSVLITMGDNYIEQAYKQCKELGIKNIYVYCHMECNRPYYNFYKRKYLKRIYMQNKQ